jgi:hypothetical protein
VKPVFTTLLALAVLAAASAGTCHPELIRTLAAEWQALDDPWALAARSAEEEMGSWQVVDLDGRVRWRGNHERPYVIRERRRHQLEMEIMRIQDELRAAGILDPEVSVPPPPILNLKVFE